MPPSPIYTRAVRTRFITLFIGRTGSTWLMDMLHRHPWVTALGEEIGRRKHLPAREQNDWLNRFYGSPSPLALAHGFKTKLWNVRDRDHLRSLIRTRRIRVVRLTRRNTLRAAISTIRSHELHAVTGDWNARSARERPPPSAIDLAQLDALIAGREREHAALEAFVRALDTPALEIAYEDLLHDRDAQLKRLARFLRTPLVGLVADRTRYAKNTPEDLSRAVANLDELRAHVAGSPYEPMLTQP